MKKILLLIFILFFLSLAIAILVESWNKVSEFGK